MNKNFDYFSNKQSTSNSSSNLSQADYDIIAANHKFLWKEEDNVLDWKQQLAKKYHDKLFKEYCISDLTYYKSNKIALRWRTKQEVISGKGENFCGNKFCQTKEELKTWEVNFKYVEEGKPINSLVKLKLCKDCSVKLNYYYAAKHKHLKKKESDKQKKKSKKANKKNFSSDSDIEEKANSNKFDDSEVNNEKDSLEQRDNIWDNKNINIIEKTIDEKIEEYLEEFF